ncbi:MAG: hypothetical protein PHD10_01680 [Bacilli bacterium]|nr:hypothetical protein [Bacilli bacterium]MDD4607833.1 hypothetical protein [Bacilli bacterium]
MKKHNLLKTIGIVFLIFVILSWIIPVASFSSGELTKGTIKPVGLIDLVYYPLITMATFIQYGIIILAIGGFYGVVNKTGVYSKLVDYLVKLAKKNEKRFLVIVISVLSLLASLTGLPWALFIAVPLLITVILSLGFSKLTAIASTVGAILVGMAGSTYGMSSGYSLYFLSLGVHTDILAKFVLLIILTFLLIMFVLSRTKKEVIETTSEEKTEGTKKGSKKTTATEKKTSEKVKVEKPLYEEKAGNKKSFWPLMIVIDLTILILLVGTYNWYLTFKMTYFTDLYNSLSEIAIGDIPILSNILGSSLTPLGYWGSYETALIIVIASLLLGWIYNIKFDEILSSFGEGAKKVLKPALLVILANVIFTIMINAQTGNIAITITNYITGLSEGVNVFATTLASAFGSFFFNDFYYLLTNVMGPIQAAWTDVEFYSVLAIVFQSVHGLMLLFLPTSMILLAGLSLCDISYKDWLKYIWKFLIQVLAVILIVALILSMLV